MIDLRMRREYLPLLLHFGEPICRRPNPPFRYDAERRVGQICLSGCWIDALDASDTCLDGVTKRTDVQKETSDDD